MEVENIKFMSYTFNSIPEVLEDIKQGKMVIIVDDESRENEGDLLMSAELVTAEAINFMATYGKGLICVPMTESRLEELNLPLMVPGGNFMCDTAFTVSIDAKETSTGISAHERAITIKKLVSNTAKATDFKKPGHIFPLKGKAGGVIIRPGHTEAAIDLSSIAGLYPAGVICEIMNDDGTMARVPQLLSFAQTHNLKISTIAALIKYRLKNEKLINRITSTELPTKYGYFKLIAYENKVDNLYHLVLQKGDLNPEKPILVRIHSECLTGDVFGSFRCDCGEQLSSALTMIEKNNEGLILYMRQEGRGIGLLNKLKAYQLQDQGKDTVEANIALGFPPDLRDYGLGVQILKDLGIKKVSLITNNPHKISELDDYGIEIVERIPIVVNPKPTNYKYLKTKKDKLGHLLDL